MHLTLFFTRGNSLGTWHSVGSLEREILLYKALQQRGMQISFVTYGTSEEAQFTRNIAGIEVLYNRWNLPLPFYELFLPWLHARSLKKSDLFKTNQMKGAHTALIAGRIWKKPVIIRMGYLWSSFLSQENNLSNKSKLVRIYENTVLKQANKVIVTTPEISREIHQRIPEVTRKIIAIPNYVDTNLFAPDPDHDPSQHLIFIGRLTKQKNLSTLIEAVALLDLSLKIIGSGELEQALKNQASSSTANIIFAGVIPNQMLPVELKSGDDFCSSILIRRSPKSPPRSHVLRAGGHWHRCGRNSRGNMPW